jgi:hypothetical protein
MAPIAMPADHAEERAATQRHLTVGQERRLRSVGKAIGIFRAQFCEVSRIRLRETTCQSLMFRGPLRATDAMRVSRLICLLPLALACSTAQGQSPQEIEAPKSPTQEVNAEWLKSCLADWDSATHMTKNEWAITCRRLSEEPAERGEISNDFEPIYKTPRKGTRGYLPDEP